MEMVRIVWHFLVHIVVGTGLFVGIGTAAVALHAFVGWAEKQGIFRELIYALQALEWLVFALDTLCFVWFVIILTLKFLREITAALR